MVDTPSIQPQQARGSSQDVPTIRPGQPGANFRSLPTVSPTGIEAQAAAFQAQAQTAETVSKFSALAAEQGLERIEALQKAQDAQTFAEIKSQAIRKGDEIRSRHLVNVKGFDAEYQKYIDEVVTGVPKHLLPAVEGELFSIGTTKRAHILGRQEQRAFNNLMTSQSLAIKDEMRDITNDIAEYGDYAGANKRIDAARVQINNSFMPAESKIKLSKDLDSLKRKSIAFHLAKTEYENGNYIGLEKSLATVYSNQHLVGDMTEEEVFEEKKEILNKIEFLENRKRQHEEDQEDDLEDLQERTAQTMDERFLKYYSATPEQIERGEVTLPSEKEITESTMEPSKKREFLRELNGEGAAINDPDTLDAITNERDPNTRMGLIRQARTNNMVTFSTYSSLLVDTQKQLDRGGASDEVTMSVDDISAFGDEMKQQGIPGMSIAKNKAIREFRRLVSAFDTDPRTKGSDPITRQRVLEEFKIQAITQFMPAGKIVEQKHLLSYPYKVFNIPRNEITLDVLKAQGEQIKRDYEAKAIPRSRYVAENAKLLRWKKILEAEQKAAQTLNPKKDN